MNEREAHVINDLSEIPPFMTEDDEREFWRTHSFGEPILEQMQPVPADDGELPPVRRASNERTRP